MRIKKGYILRKLGEEYIAVAVGEAGKQFNGMIRMNAVGAWLWEQLKNDVSQEELLSRFCANFAELTHETAQADLNEFLESIGQALER